MKTLPSLAVGKNGRAPWCGMAVLCAEPEVLNLLEESTSTKLPRKVSCKGIVCFQNIILLFVQVFTASCIDVSQNGER